jgi:hypothetical protein
MKRFALTTLAALVIGTAAFAHPAEARCWSNGYSWHCWHPREAWRHHHYWGPQYGHYWGPRYGYGYGSEYGPRWHSRWGY